MKHWLSLAIILILFVGCKDTLQEMKPKTVKYTNWGTLTKISNCSRTKYEYRCWVYSDKVSWSTKINIENFPYNNLRVGDRVGREEICENTYCTVYWCSNGMCSSVNRTYY